MYAINKNLGIGEIIETTETMYVVAFEDCEKKLLKQFTTTYATIEEAELALDPEMTQEEVDARMADEAAKVNTHVNTLWGPGCQYSTQAEYQRAQLGSKWN